MQAHTEETCYKVGEHVERRDPGQEWATGYVTSLDPLQVTATNCPTDDGWTWNEVRKLEVSNVFGPMQDQVDALKQEIESVKTSSVWQTITCQLEGIKHRADAHDEKMVSSMNLISQLGQEIEAIKTDLKNEREVRTAAHGRLSDVVKLELLKRTEMHEGDLDESRSASDPDDFHMGRVQNTSDRSAAKNATQEMESSMNVVRREMVSSMNIISQLGQEIEAIKRDLHTDREERVTAHKRLSSTLSDIVKAEPMKHAKIHEEYQRSLAQVKERMDEELRAREELRAKSQGEKLGQILNSFRHEYQVELEQYSTAAKEVAHGVATLRSALEKEIQDRTATVPQVKVVPPGVFRFSSQPASVTLQRTPSPSPSPSHRAPVQSNVQQGGEAHRTVRSPVRTPATPRHKDHASAFRNIDLLIQQLDVRSIQGGPSAAAHVSTAMLGTHQTASSPRVSVATPPPRSQLRTTVQTIKASLACQSAPMSPLLLSRTSENGSPGKVLVRDSRQNIQAEEVPSTVPSTLNVRHGSPTSTPRSQVRRLSSRDAPRSLTYALPFGNSVGTPSAPALTDRLHGDTVYVSGRSVGHAPVIGTKKPFSQGVGHTGSSSTEDQAHSCMTRHSSPALPRASGAPVSGSASVKVGGGMPTAGGQSSQIPSFLRPTVHTNSPDVGGAMPTAGGHSGQIPSFLRPTYHTGTS